VTRLHPDLVPLLADPVRHAPVRVESADGIDGRIVAAAGDVYPLRNGIPRMVVTDDAGQRQTQGSFGFKWEKRDTYDSPAVWEQATRWLVERYGFDSIAGMREHLAGKGRVLDAGCGSGFSSSMWLTPGWGGALWVGLDISSAIDVAAERLRAVESAAFVQGDVLQPPFRDGAFDAIFSEGVLHHTPSTERAFRALIRLLAPGGEILAYVYRRKGPIREFTDDYIREAIADLPPDQAWEQLRPLTRLGQSLAELHAEVDVAEDVPLLGIKAGRYDVQRLLYWHVAKMFWNPAYSFEENHHINFDWYHPRYAHRHTQEEVRSWCESEGLRVVHFDEQESGHTVRAVKAA
jgi:SAM-dependent methyltransferase